MGSSNPLAFAAQEYQGGEAEFGSAGAPDQRGAEGYFFA
jgi:hypothetical protein